MISAKSPAEIDYTAYGINDALIIDNTGAWRDEKGLGEHLKAKGSSTVLLTAPGKGDIPNIVYGVNHEGQSIEKNKIFTAASCTTNAIVPVIKVIEDSLELKRTYRNGTCLHQRSEPVGQLSQKSTPRTWSPG